MPQIYAFLASFFKYIFIAVIYIFIFGIMRMIFLDIKKVDLPRPKGIPKGVPYLQLVTDGNTLYFEVLKSYPLDREIIVIGRGVSSDITIDDLYLSARHVKLWNEHDEWYITDLNSTNGTYVNGAKMGKEPLILDSGDKIRIGQLEFLVVV